MKARMLMAIALAGLLAIGCADKAREAEAEARAKADAQAKADADAKKAVDDKAQVAVKVQKDDKDSNWGTITGTIVYDPKATLPKNDPVTVSTDKAFCTAKGPILKDEWIVDAKTRGVKNVIVWLHPADKGNEKMDWPAAKIHPKLKDVPKKLVVDQPVCTFMPRIILLREGTELVFKNSAAVTHNVSIEGGKVLGPQLNLTIPPGKDLEIGSVKSRFVPVPYKCTIHPWMKGYLNSFNHPYYAVTNEKGEFEIKDAPVGTFRLQVWHEGYGFVQKGPKDRGIDVTIAAGKNEVKVPPLIEDTE